MNVKTLVILLLVFGLGIAALLLMNAESDRTTDDQTDSSADAGPNTQDQPLLSEELLGSGLTRITLDGGLMGTLLELELAQGRWQLNQPHRIPADTQAVNELLTLLASLTGHPADQHGGLVPDASGIILEHNGEKHSIWFSSRLGAGRAVVTLANGDQYQNHIVQDTLHDLFDNLDRTVFFADEIDPPLMPEVGSVEITTPQGTSVLTQRDGRWWIGSDAEAQRALEDSIENHFGISAYFEHLRSIELTEPQVYSNAERLKSFGLAQPLIQVRLTPIDASTADTAAGLELRVGVPADPADQTRYLSVGRPDAKKPAVFKVERNAALTLSTSVTQFRDPRITSIPPRLIASIEFEDAGKNTVLLDLTSEPAAFATEGLSADVSPQQRDRLLDQLTRAHPVDYVKPDLSTAQPILSAEIKHRLRGRTETFAIYPDPESDSHNPTLLVQRGIESTALRIERVLIAALIDPHGRLKSRED